MRRFSFATPPQTGGIYALKNIETGQVYIGQTINFRRRFSEWRALANGSLGNAGGPTRFVLITDPEAWEFIVVLEMDDTSRPTLDAAERAAIKHWRAELGDKLLNIPESGEPPERQGNTPGVANTAASTLTYQGRTVSYREARDILGVTPKSLAKRLTKYRQKGMTEVSVEMLLERSAKPGCPKSYVAP